LVYGLLILALGFGLDGVGTSSSLVRSVETERQEAPPFSRSSYGAQNEARVLPTRSRL
jgi:hypothetical protein